MGREITSIEFSRADRLLYRDKVRANLKALRQLMDEGRFETGRKTIGAEMELYLIDAEQRVSGINEELLDRISATEWQTEFGSFNVEFFTHPDDLRGNVLAKLERDLNEQLTRVRDNAAGLGAQVAMIGILPTVTREDLTAENLTAMPRYHALDNQILRERGEDLRIFIQGRDSLDVYTPSVAFEAACTSYQLHLQVDPLDFARYWNAAQALSAPLVAIAANSPFFLQRQLHHETRITLFEQAIDTRTDELKEQGVRPRVWFGERWLTKGLFELFDENVRYFSALLPVCDGEDPFAMLADGHAPGLAELTLHNGTIYRWNRPVYDAAGDTPHMRIENRVLPAGPTVIDAVANAAFYYGLIAALHDAERPVWERMSFATAQENLQAAAVRGVGARLYWPGTSIDTPVCELILRHLLPLAHEGLRRWGVDERDVDRYLGVIEQRALTEQTGAVWQIQTHDKLTASGTEFDEAFVELVRRYQELSIAGEPVHSWPVAG